MEWTGQDVVNGIPVILAGRPGRNRPRLASEHMYRPVVYLQDSNRHLDPATFGAGIQRAASASGHRQHSPAQIFINNSNRDDHSPARAPRRRSQVDIHYDDDSFEEGSHTPRRRDRWHRSRSRARYHDRESRTPSRERQHEIDKRVELQKRLQKLEDLERKEEEEEQRQRYEQELIIKAAEKEKEKQKEEEMKKAAVEEYNQKQAEKAAKEKKEKEEADKAFQERLRATFAAAGYSEQSIERILQKEKQSSGGGGGQQLMALTRPTYIKVNRKHLSPDTLDAYNLPWEWDEVGFSHE